MQNPESLVVAGLRQLVLAQNGVFIKTADRFTRGIPDCIICVGRIVLVEAKVGSFDEDVCVWNRLGLSGIQDSRLREFSARQRGVAAVYTAQPRLTESATIWVPVKPEVISPNGVYRAAARGVSEVTEWLCQRAS